MIGTLAGLGTMYGMRRFDPVGMNNANRFIVGLTPLASMNVGETLTYNMPEARVKGVARSGVIYEGFGTGFIGTRNKTLAGAATNAQLSGTGQLTGPGIKSPQSVQLKTMVPTGKVAWAGSLLGPAMSAGMILSGVSEGGLSGGLDALFFDYATSRAASNNMFTTKIDKVAKTVSVTRNVGMLGSFGVFGGAAMGYEVGNAIAGVPGGFAGAAAGGRLAKLAVRNPVLAVPAILGSIGAAKVGEMAIGATSHIISKGSQRARRKYSIDTAGDTASFFTRNAMTTRGRAFEAMRKSHLNARSALGMEANMMHMNRSYY